MTGPRPTAHGPRHWVRALSLGLVLTPIAIAERTAGAAPQTVRDTRPAPTVGTSVIGGRVITVGQRRGARSPRPRRRHEHDARGHALDADRRRRRVRAHRPASGAVHRECVEAGNAANVVRRDAAGSSRHRGQSRRGPEDRGHRDSDDAGRRRDRSRHRRAGPAGPRRTDADSGSAGDRRRARRRRRQHHARHRRGKDRRSRRVPAVRPSAGRLHRVRDSRGRRRRTHADRGRRHGRLRAGVLPGHDGRSRRADRHGEGR